MKTTITEIYPYLKQYNVRGFIDDEGSIHHFEFCFDHEPEQNEIDVEVSKVEVRILKEKEFAPNPINELLDEGTSLDYLRNIKKDAVTYIRNNPTVSNATALAALQNKYPSSLIYIDRLITWYRTQYNIASWNDFKTFVTNNKFKDID